MIARTRKLTLLTTAVIVLGLVVAGFLQSYLVTPQVVLASPDTLILRPESPGDSAELTPFPAATANWDCVDEVTPDGDSTYVYSDSNLFGSDFYNFANTSQTGDINSVTVWAKVRGTAAANNVAKTLIKTNGVIYEGAAQDAATGYSDISTFYDENPQTDDPWTWDEVNLLQAGCALKRAGPTDTTRCTQVWVEVDCTPPAPTVTATPADSTAGATTTYTIGFTTGVALAVLAPADQIIITFPAGFDASLAAVDAATTTPSGIDPTPVSATATVVTLAVGADEVIGAFGIVLSGIVNTQTAGSYTISVRTEDGAGVIIEPAVDSAPFTIDPAAAPSLQVSGITDPVVAGTASDVTVTALDPYGDIDTNYTGTITFTSSDAQAVLPADYTFLAGDNGVKTFTAGVTLKTTGEQSVTATDTVTFSITGSQTAITVNPGPAASFNVVAPGTVTAGVAFSVTLTALDAYGNTATGYTGVVSIDFGSTAMPSPNGTPPQIPSPKNINFKAGLGTRAGFILTNAHEIPTITATDAAIPITGTSANITVTWAAAASFDVATSGSATEIAGVTFSVTLTALDAYGNTATGYNAAAVIIDFTSTATTAPDATLPTIPTPQTLDFSVTPGIATATGFILVNAGETPTITATDGTISGTSAAITVNAVIDHYTVTSVSYFQARGVAFTVTVTAYDQYGNLLITDSSTQVTLSSSSATTAFDGDGNGTFGEAEDDSKTLSAGTFDIQARDTNGGTGVTITATDSNAKTGVGSPYTIYALGGGGGGGVAPPPPPPLPSPSNPAPLELEVNLWGNITLVNIGEDGVLLEGVTATSPDGRLSLTIAEGTQVLGPDGNPLAELTVETILDPLDAPEGYHVIVAFDFGPDGTTCNPSIEITIEYDPDALPEGVDEANLVIAYYDESAGEWLFVTGEVDPAANMVTFSAGHFTTFAILAAVAAEVTPTPVPSLASEGGLSGGAWAGIGVGIIAVLGLPIWLVLRRFS